jgi:hypothetical protein
MWTILQMYNHTWDVCDMTMYEMQLVPAGRDWMYDPERKPHSEIDSAHVVQLQFQMHATGTQVGYLSSCSLGKGTRLFKVQYSEDFMREASAVLKQVMTYLMPGACLPHCDITKEHEDLQRPWYRMMDRLQDCISGVQNLGEEGADTSPFRCVLLL